jgi:hypothetical protein
MTTDRTPAELLDAVIIRDGLDHDMGDRAAFAQTLVDRRFLLAQLAEQRSINVALTEKFKLGFCSLDRFDTCGDPFCTDAREMLGSTSKAATEWRTQVAKEAVEAERERLDSVVTSLREALYAAIMTFEGGAELGLTPDQMYQAAKSLETTPGLFASDSTPGAALSPEQPEVTE